jgi:hypothetical protein
MDTKKSAGEPSSPAACSAHLIGMCLTRIGTHRLIRDNDSVTTWPDEYRFAFCPDCGKRLVPNAKDQTAGASDARQA